ncbi:MAG: putative lipid II flippase MurJ [Phycisphaerae bacterium]|nr:MAG: putative lipid II flippase MurJ [Phycisphaerae bacterium]
MTLASRVLGLAREMAYGYFFGISTQLSEFRIAFLIPNLTRRLFGEGALTSAFIPVFAKCRNSDGDEAAKRLAGGVVTLVAVILTTLLVFAEIGLLIAQWNSPRPVIHLTIILLPYMVLICLTATLAGVLNSLHRFAAPALAPILLNVIIIGTTWFGGKWLDLNQQDHFILIAFSVLAAGVVQVTIQVLWLKSINFSIIPNFDWRSPQVMRVIKLTIPMIVGASAIQLNTLIDSLIAYLLVKDGEGPATLGYAQQLGYLPLGVFSTAIATAIFPLLSERVAEDDEIGFAKSLDSGLRTSLFFAIPSAVGLIMTAPLLVRLAFERGEFNSADSERVVAAMVCYCLGLWAFALQQILVRGYYAKENTKTPIRISLAMVGLNFLLNIILVQTALREAGVALATAITASLQVGLLAMCLRNNICEFRWASTAWSGFKACVAAAVMAGVLWLLSESSGVGSTLPIGDGLRLALSVAVGAIVFAIVSRILRCDELDILMRKQISMRE